ncbi:cation tolerance protein : Adenylyl cyclase class-3/4/guanylyl cyclase OS=Gallionella capsiferriformans (strain ES-2) GN=Galf_1180 PE=4 SV=1: Guanylate_cyc: cNMP_binding [Gemmata massiliana]|uniref:Cyclic nucleotide-binding domain-containing protein n=1 Tax=Gemmata massiliana TaxID=1210884 RepID=A0A6P2DCY1_9BACT|nr:cyclic nucleotide-binding domain-containing protein [Gemmata massiliana]VTR99141.1 cation tolerance protein : Adenylyl cyclase class-3/4/guanylyl cyclase OS=Gallionella capsiferriformans (strain ES-2) GN=Galf_1180 PE=4 SV=1: Guanylate_cyc: cNMP_binding [Gemmata massiliana]
MKDDVVAARAQAFTVTIDIYEFSKQPGDKQWVWYKTLQTVTNTVLTELGIEIAKDVEGSVFWSPGGDGGTISVIKGGAAVAMQFAVRTAAELNNKPDGTAPNKFDVRIGIDKGSVHIGLDLNGSPNVWGTAINNSHRIAAACDPGQVLASESFIEELRSQTHGMDAYIDRVYLDKKRSQKRLAKHGQFFGVVNVHHAGEKVGRPVSGDNSIHVADFEEPFNQMVASYRAYLQEAINAKVGIWTLLLSRKLFDMGALSKLELFDYVSRVSLHGEEHDANNPRDPFFSRFGSSELKDMMYEGRFRKLSAGSELCKIGDSGDELYILARGRLEIYDSHGLVATREPGSVVGEMALVEAGYLRLCENNPKRTARMAAKKDEDVTLFAVPYSAIRLAANSSNEILPALVRSYSEKQKENAVKESRCFGSLRKEEKIFIHSEGTLTGLWPASTKAITCTTECLVICCHGKVTVEGAKETATIRGQMGNVMQSVWVPNRAGIAQRVVIRTDVPSEVLLWHGPNWRDWLQSTPSRNLRAVFAEVCDGTV